MPETTAPTLDGVFIWLDWAVVAGYLAFTTILGGVLAGKQATIRDFFLGGRKLPWYAVSGSIIATEISALTFVGLPYVVFQPGGNFTYLQLGVFGSLLARLIVGYVLVPAYYRREIYSPYDFMGDRLGEAARKVTTIFFGVSGMLAQSARVFLTALVLELILGDSVLGYLQELTGISTLAWAIWTVGLIAIVWTLMGGITTVIWTDVILFVVFLAGAFLSLGFVVSALEGGWSELFAAGSSAGKFRFFDFDPSPAAQYTIWTAVIASTWHNVGAYGTDQLIAQRMFCCRGPREARWAIISSYAGLLVTVTVMLVGVGLHAYYQAHPLSGASLQLYEKQGDRIFPLFILQVLPPGLRGLLIAAIMAAAISSLDSILAALSQTTISAFYLPWRRRRMSQLNPENVRSDAAETGRVMREDRHVLRASRVAVIGWGIALCLLAQLAAVASEHYRSILDLGLGMAGYAGGALIAGFLLAFLPLKADGSGLVWSAPISLLTVFAAVWHQSWAQAICALCAALILVMWIGLELPRWQVSRWRRSAWLIVALLLLLTVSRYAYSLGSPDAQGNATCVTVAWPWYTLIGCTMAFVFGWLLARPRSATR